MSYGINDIWSYTSSGNVYLFLFLMNWLAESDAGGTFMVYYRWGRVGVKGQNKIQGPYTSRDSAINEFKQKFYDKTENDWPNRKMFESFPHHYMWIEMDYNEEEKQLSVSIHNFLLIFA